MTSDKNLQAEPSSNLYRLGSLMDLPSCALIKSLGDALGSQVSERSTTTAKGLSLGLRHQAHEEDHCDIGGVAVLILHPQESPALQLSGCKDPTCCFRVPLRRGALSLSVHLCAVRLRHEDDGTRPPRPLGSSLGPFPHSQEALA